MAYPKKRTASIAAIGLVMIVCAVFYLYYFVARPIGSGPAGPTVAAADFSQIWTERSVRVIGIGDSVTAGFGADSTDHSYFNRMILNPGDEFSEMQNISLSSVLPNLISENISVSGSTSLDHIVTINEKLKPSNEEVFGLVVMTTGGNDIIHSYGRRPAEEGAMYGATVTEAEPWISGFRVRLNIMLDQITANFPGGCEIYLCDIYDPTDAVGDAPSLLLPDWPDGLAVHTKYNQVIRECAAKHPNVFLVPLHQTFLGHGSHCRQFWKQTYVFEDPTHWYYSNVEDPNDRGYDAIRRIFLNSIVKNSQLLK
ncbi:MAG: SGNH/GDSL hydrolase family protein [Pirellulales bacterium]